MPLSEHINDFSNQLIIGHELITSFCAERYRGVIFHTGGIANHVLVRQGLIATLFSADVNALIVENVLNAARAANTLTVDDDVV